MSKTSLSRTVTMPRGRTNAEIFVKWSRDARTWSGVMGPLPGWSSQVAYTLTKV